MSRNPQRALTEAEKHRFLLDARERRIRELEVTLAANRAVAAKVRRRDETIATLRGRIIRLELRLECGAALLKEAAADSTNGPLARAVRTFLGAQA